MSDLIYSPVEVKDEIINTFPDLSFFQPYIDGTFDNNPNKGHIVVGVRTPWYDLVYLDIKAGGFWNKYINESGMKNILKEVVTELDAALTIQVEFGTNGPIRIDREELSKYRKDPKGYIESRRKSEVHTKIVAVEPDPKDIIDEKNNKDVVILMVDHDNSLNSTEEDMINAEHLTFLCTCRECKKEFYRIRDIRVKKDKEKK